MKKTLLIIHAVLAVCFGAPFGFRTANAAKASAEKPTEESPVEVPPPVEVEDTSTNPSFNRRIFQVPPPVEVEDTSTLGLLCKGAGVDPEDVRWRMNSGLEVKQAVDAALAQKQANDLGKKGGK